MAARSTVTTHGHDMWLKSKFITDGQLGQPGSTAIDAVAAIDKTVSMTVVAGADTTITNFQSAFFQRNIDVDLPTGQLTVTKAGLYGIVGHIQVAANGNVDTLFLRLKVNGVTSREFVLVTSDVNSSSGELSSYENLAVGDIVTFSVFHTAGFPADFTLTSAQIDMTQIQAAV